jgi:hypothetical protein
MPRVAAEGGEGLFVVGIWFVFTVMADADGQFAQPLQSQNESNAQALRHIFRENDLDRVEEVALSVEAERESNAEAITKAKRLQEALREFA